MDLDLEKQLEKEIDRELKQLPELVAPATLSKRTMAEISKRHALAWYRLPWQLWPAPLRFAGLAVMLLAFGSLCAASWQLTRAAGYTAAMEEVANLVSGLSSIWNVANVLVTSVTLVIKHFGTTFMIVACVAAAMGYFVCVGLGTALVRLAWRAK